MNLALLYNYKIVNMVYLIYYIYDFDYLGLKRDLYLKKMDNHAHVDLGQYEYQKMEALLKSIW